MKNRIFGLLLILAALSQHHVNAHPGARSAIEYFSRQIEHSPRDQSLYIHRGIAYSSDGQYESALADFQRARTLGNPVVVSFDLGVLHYRRGELDTAKAHFDEYLEAFPDHSGCLEYRARLLRDRGDFAASVADFQRVFALLERPNPGHYISVARMLEDSGPAGTEQALSVLDSGIGKLGLTPQLQKYAIQLELDRRRPHLAIVRLQTLEPMLGKSPDWKVEMAALQLQIGEEDAAQHLLKEATMQLDTLRRTPARQALRERIDRLN